MATDAKT